MTIAISALLSTPFYEGGALNSEDVPALYPVALNGRAYMVDLRKYRRTTLPLLRNATDQSNEPGEQSLNTEGLWRRSAVDWRYGAGQLRFDGPDSDRRRFQSSKGVDCWTEGELTLLADTANRRASVATNLSCLVVGAYLYLVDGQSLVFTDDAAVSVPTWSTATLTGIAADITGVATDGSNIFVCNGAGLWKATVGSTGPFGTLGATTPDRLFYGNGRLLGSDGPLLYELDAAGVKTDIKTHVNASFAWEVSCVTGKGFYVAGTAGNVSELYFIGVDSSTGALTKPVVATAWPAGETIEGLAAYAGAVLIGSSRGVRLALPADDGSLSYGPVIAVGPVRAFAAETDDVWFGWENYDVSSTGLGRMQPGRFTDTLVSAYASDLMAAGQGQVDSVARFETRTYFTVAGVGLFGETTDLVTSGTIDSGWIDFATVEPKVPVSLVLAHAPLAGSVAVSIIADDADATNIGLSSTAGTTEPIEPFPINQDQVGRLQVRLTLTRDAVATTGPTVRRWTVRALPASVRIDEILLPLIIKSKVEPFHEASWGRLVTLTEFEFLKGLENAAVAVTYQEGATVYQVRVDRVEVNPESWTDEHDFFEGLIVVRLLTLES